MAYERSPAFQFYPQDFLADDKVQVMPPAAVGCYWLLCCHAWLKRKLPNDTEILRKLARYQGSRSNFENRIWIHVVQCFRLTDDGWIHPRLEREREKQAINRENGRRGGEANAKRLASHAKAKGEANLNLSSSSSSSVSDPNNKLNRERSVSSTSGNGNAPLSPASRKSDPFANDDITERAGRFVEHYAELYPKYRNGARYAIKPVRDYAAAVTLCRTWPDDERLHKLAVCFLTTDHKFAEEGSRTISQFLALASWADGELSAWEQKNQPTKIAKTSDAPKQH